MSSTVLYRSYKEPEIRRNEVLRYAGCKGTVPETEKLLNDCIGEINDRLSYKVCYTELPVTVSGDICDFGLFSVRSQKLAVNLKNCDRVILFAATVGLEIDRLIARYKHISLPKALMLQALGAERIETLCDTFCADISEEMGIFLRPRFSPGYGDLPLETQKDIVAVLECSKKIGVTLTESLLMSPSKSVTAFAGISKCREKTDLGKCDACNKKDCSFRGAV